MKSTHGYSAKHTITLSQARLICFVRIPWESSADDVPSILANSPGLGLSETDVDYIKYLHLNDHIVAGWRRGLPSRGGFLPRRF
jgi:hypothetical protein